MLTHLLLLLLPSASAATITVGVDKTYDYQSIQEAIEASTDGDTITVGAGSYVEAIDFDGKDIEIISDDGAAVTFLTPPSSTDAVTFGRGESSDATLDGFTIQPTGARGLFIES